MIAALALAALVAGAWAFWRYYWFFRDPPRTPPAAAGLVSAADGVVVYVKRVEPGEDVFTIKEGVPAKVRDIAREDDGTAKLVVGVFMSPFDIHYNRAPLEGRVASFRRYPAAPENLDMGEMQWRTLTNRPPLYRDSVHIVQNERAVTRIDGTWHAQPLSVYVVQIGARTVHGIDSFVRVGDRVARGQTFGMIRIGSQVDLVIPWRDGMRPAVHPGERVRAGETLLVR
ncbi:MAG TPA: phosphatidylserine decarboxylase [Usitatibacter sp.]|nr:phosphatidylserine decarboxylase [Usitatibacter sp.]